MIPTSSLSCLLIFIAVLTNSVNGGSSPKAICYSDLGCFNPWNATDFGFDHVVPDPPKQIGTQFFLFTRANQKSGPMTIDISNLRNFDCKKKTIFAVHGWTQNSNAMVYVQLTQTLLNMFDVNVIRVNWALGAADGIYVQSAINTQLVGRQIAQLVKQLSLTCGLNINNVHLIGHSLGAQTCGFAGQWIQEIMKAKVGRISGMEPANVLFEHYPPEQRLDATDAQFVDVVHTSTDFGYIKPCGHVDFYLNGAKMQPICAKNLTDQYCSHNSALKYFTKSIYNKCPFLSNPCPNVCPCNNNCGRMGFYSNTAPGRGPQYLTTIRDGPYCNP